jgi:hypothetical protein
MNTGFQGERLKNPVLEQCRPEKQESEAGSSGRRLESCAVAQISGASSQLHRPRRAIHEARNKLAIGFVAMTSTGAMEAWH